MHMAGAPDDSDFIRVLKQLAAIELMGLIYLRSVEPFCKVLYRDIVPRFFSLPAMRAQVLPIILINELLW